MTGEIREAIYDQSSGTWVVGDQLAYQGKEGCRNVTCTRRGIGGDSECIGWHCSTCHEPCSSQGHDCPTRRIDG